MKERKCPFEQEGAFIQNHGYFLVRQMVDSSENGEKTQKFG
jgi:hypothetical protein